MATSFFFAFGADMAPDAMAGALGRPVRGVRALLRGYRLAFTAYSDDWDGGVADILEDPEGEVEGVLFALTPRDLLRLEFAEGWQDPRYRRESVTVELEDGRTVEAAVRVVDARVPSVAPSPTFIDAMVQGATDAGLSDGYVEWLLQLYPDPAATRRGAWPDEE